MIRVSVVPPPAASQTVQIIEDCGGEVVPLEDAQVVVWQINSADGLAETIMAAPHLRWVQLTSAGVDWLLASGLGTSGVTWTCAKGSTMGENAAEHALLLMLAAARELYKFMCARDWMVEGGRRLAGSNIGILGGGGIGGALSRLLVPFDVDVTVVKREPCPVEGARRVVGPGSLDAVIGSSDFFVLAAPLTEATRGLIDGRRLAFFRPDAWLVNVARGGLVCTDDLLIVLREGVLGGAALDVVDPEPLPVGHPLWDMENVILTPHVASTRAMAPGAVANVLGENMRRWARGVPLVGVVDLQQGY